MVVYHIPMNEMPSLEQGSNMDSNRFDRILRQNEELSKPPDDDLIEFMKRAGYECDSAIDDSIDFEFQPKLRQTVHVRSKRNKIKTSMQRKSRKRNRKG